jgi:hypothetical protein
LPESAELDRDLATVIEAWPALPDAVRAGILTMVRANQPEAIGKKAKYLTVNPASPVAANEEGCKQGAAAHVSQ